MHSSSASKLHTVQYQRNMRVLRVRAQRGCGQTHGHVRAANGAVQHGSAASSSPAVCDAHDLEQDEQEHVA